MSGRTAGELVLVLLGAATVAAAVGCTRAGRRIWTPLAVAGLLAAAAVAGAAEDVALDRGWVVALVGLAGVLALVGGGPVTTVVFELVDRREHASAPSPSLAEAATLLRGGLFIGVLERLAVFVSVAAGSPEGVAVVLAVKGLGRYPELRATGSSAVAERFIIGTFSSVLWAVGCAGVVLLARVLG